MFRRSIIISIVLLLVFQSCKTEYKFVLNTPKKIQVNQELTLSVSEKKNMPYDSIEFNIDGRKIKSTNNTATISLKDYRLGKHTITALVFYEGKTKKIEKPIYFMADAPPVIYTFNLINTFPHDPKSYTQGLEFIDGFIYEGTGQKGTSYIRKTVLNTGEVLQQTDLDAKYFGEGITILNDKLYQLTWRDGIGFIYDLNSFEKLSEFKYTKSREGWGLTNNGEKLIKTDGTERIWFLNPDTLLEETYIEAYTNTQKVEKLNELEYFNGKIYANRWQLNSIMIIDPKNGKVEGVADLNPLRTEILKTQSLKDDDEVLNGIAFDKVNNRMFVTGKHWGKIFEIELVKK